MKSKNLSPTEERKEKKRKLAELSEKIDVLGQESEDGAVKWVKEAQKEEDKAAQQENDNSLNKLDLNKKNLSYSQILIEEALSFMKGFDIPFGFYWGVLKTSKGIVFWYQTPDKKVYAKGNTISFVPEIDMNGVVRRVFRMIDDMERIEDEKNKSDEPKIIV